MIQNLKKILKRSPYDLYCSFRQKKIINASAKIIDRYITHTDVKKLHIGCGGNEMQGWLNTDLVPYTSNIAFLDASVPFPVGSNLFEHIYSEHTFEHLDFKGQLNYLTESYRVLMPGGKLRIATPDFDFLMRLKAPEISSLEKNYLQWNINTFVPSVKAELKTINEPEVYVINNYFRDWGHQLIHNKKNLQQLMEHAGFINVNIGEVSKSSHTAFKNLDKHGAMITEEYNLLETMVLEAEKPL
jgi:predicted SAM-dependent methyltransferase